MINDTYTKTSQVCIELTAKFVRTLICELSKFNHNKTWSVVSEVKTWYVVNEVGYISFYYIIDGVEFFYIIL